MKSPFGSLLALRRVEEKQAEVGLAEALRDLEACERELDAARRRREAWLEHHLDPDNGAEDLLGVAYVLDRLARVEREAERRRDMARAHGEAAREALLDRKRHREAVERLHLDVLAEQARLAARRSQNELDDLAGIGAARRRREHADSR